MSLTGFRRDGNGTVQDVSASNPLPVTINGANNQVQGAAASGTSTTVNPVDVSAQYSASLTTQADGTRRVLQSGQYGALRVELFGASSTTGVLALSAGADAISNVISGLYTYARPSLYNGTSWDRQLTIQGTTAGTGIGVTAVHTSPNSSANAGIALSATAAASSAIVLKGSAGNLYGVTCVAGASAGYIMLFNATTAPADGAVTPIWVMPVAANAGLAFSFDVPVYCSTGITAVFSTTGPFTKTASPTAFISGMVK